MGQRRESVHLGVTDELGPALIRDAAAAELLKRQLAGLDGQFVRSSRSMTGAQKDIEKHSRSLDQGASSLDRYTGRLSFLAQTMAVIGPSAIPIAAVAAPAVAGLTTLLAGAAVGAGSLVVALQGVGDATKAIDAYQADRTPENLAKVRAEMAKLGPDAAKFVREWQKFQPVLGDLRDAAARGWLPGLGDAFEDLTVLAPRAAQLLEDVGRAGGEVVSGAAESFTTERWTPFFDFVTRELPTALTSLAQITGDLAHGAAEMWMSFDPGNDAFISWLEKVAQGFDNWASSAQGREDIEAFLAYVRETGPDVEELFVALVKALTQITQAAAPLGGPVLDGLTAIANVISSIADSDLGTPIFTLISALSLLKLAFAGVKKAKDSALAGGLTGAAGSGLSPSGYVGSRFAGLGSVGSLITPMSAGQRASRSQSAAFLTQQSEARRAMLGTAAVAGALTLAYSGVAEKADLSNTANGAFLGTLTNSAWGVALGATAGFLKDIAAANNDVYESLGMVDDAMSSGAIGNAASGYADALAQAEDFRRKVEEDGLGWSALGDPSAAGANAKNFIEGVFGSSDVEEHTAAVEDAKAKLDAMSKSVASLAKEFGISLGPLDGSEASYRELQAAVTELQPHLDDARVTWDELTAAQQIKSGTGGDWLQTAAAVATAGASFHDLKADIVGADDATRGATDSERAHREAIRATEQELRDEEQALRDTIQALHDKTDANLAQFDNQLAYREALKEATRLGKQNDAGIRGNSKAALANAHALSTLAGTWNSNKDSVINNVGAYKRARDEFIDSATAMGVTKQAAERLADQYLKMPKSVLTKINADASQALSAVDQTKRYLASIKDRTVYVNVQQRTFGRGNINAQLSGNGADGTTIPKTGKPYADRHLYMLADGEEVISNRHGQADRHRSLLKAINAGRLADGGSAGSAYGSNLSTAWPTFGMNSNDPREAARALKVLTAALDKATTVLDRETQARSAVISQVVSNFVSDPFAVSEGSSDIFAKGATAGGIIDPIAALRAQNKQTRQYRSIIRSLRKRGLDGDALGEVDTLAEAQAIQGYSRSQIRQYERAYGTNQSLARSAGSTLADGVGKTVAELKDLRAEVQRLRKDVRAADKNNQHAQDKNADKIGHHVTGAANRAGRDSRGHNKP